MSSKGTFNLSRRGFGFGFASFLMMGASASAANESGVGKSIKGILYPIGGAADAALYRFAELAGAENARILILPHSSSSQKETVEELQNSFMALGVKNTDVIMPGEYKNFPKCTAIFLTGGDQSRMMRTAEPALLQAVRDFANQGNLVGGTSAGAAIMAPKMIAGGMSDGMPRSKSLLMNEGLGLIPGYIVDTHVSARARQDRLMVALSLTPNAKGIGLDEDTAVEIKDGKATVHGKGCAHVYRRADDFKSAMQDTPDGISTSVQNVLYSIYPAGETFLI